MIDSRTYVHTIYMMTNSFFLSVQISVPVCVVGYKQLTGHWPDFSNSEDLQKVGAEAFAFVNFARLAVPLRIGLALSTTPWVEENVVKKFKKDESTEA